MPKNRLRELRRERKLSGIAVANKLDITPQYYYDIEKGERRLTTEIAAKLVPVFQATVDYIIGVADINYYGESVESVESKNPLSEEKESDDIESIINNLSNHTLEYKGHILTEEQKKHFIQLLQNAAAMMKQ